MGGSMVSGSPCVDAPMLDRHSQRRWLLQSLGHEFCFLVFVRDNSTAERYRDRLRQAKLTLRLVVVLPSNVAATVDGALTDHEGLAKERYGGESDVTYLIRPDQHVAARFMRFDLAAITQAHARSLRGAES